MVNAPVMPAPAGGAARREGFSTALRVTIALALLILTLFPLYWIIIVGEENKDARHGYSHGRYGDSHRDQCDHGSSPV